MNRVSAGALIAFALLISTSALAVLLLVDIDYIRWIENDPLNNSVRVVRFEGDKIELEDGRVVKLLVVDDDFEQMLREPEPRVELVPSPGSDSCRVYCRRQRFICGLGSPPIHIPLIPRDTPRYVKSFGLPATYRKP